MQPSLHGLGVKIFADGADKPTMLSLYANALIRGVTTNPTLMKKAGISDYEIDCWFGILAPTDMPAAIAKRLRDEVAKAVAAPDVAEGLDQQGMRAVASEPEEWSAYLKSELARYAKIIKDTSIKPE